jgi:4-hydroxythreonine-4-phosphate dehydrogenase
MGDPAGVGLDIALLAWLRRNTDGVPPFAFLCDAGALCDRATTLQLDVPITEIAHIGEAKTAFAASLPVLPVAAPLTEPVVAGTPSVVNAPAVQASIEAAVKLALSGEVSAVVTNPIAKSVMAASGFPHPGHTEFLGALARAFGADANPVMMLCGPDLRVVPVTIHIALADVPGELTTELIVNTACVVAADLRCSFGIERPRLAVTGLNPHGGEGGLMGTEEQTIIAPAITALQAEGYAVTGPHPADTLFHARARQNYDAVLAMYHDQALIPLKTLAFDEGVNVTLGLPFVRTSPDHGTAFDIAGTGKAHPHSLIAALKLAAKMGAQRSGDGGRAPAGSSQ